MDAQTTEKTSYISELTVHTREGHDARVLARLGKRSVLERRFGVISILGFICTILITWEGSLTLFTTGLTNGGSAGDIYGFLFVWVGTLAVFTTMAELASMAPTSGGQYHWVSMLAPPSYRNFMSYIMGWLVIAGWQAVLASGGYLCGTMIEALIQLNNPGYVPQQWHGTLLFWAVVVIAVLINTITSHILPQFEVFILVVHILGFFAVLIPLVRLAPAKASAHDVFTVFSNGGAWPTQGLSFFVGLIGNVFAMFGTMPSQFRYEMEANVNLLSGCDSAVHMAEEIHNADTVIPWSMVTSVLFNGALGFAMNVAVLFVTTDITAALSSPTGILGYPFMEIFYNATGSRIGSSLMIAIVIVMDTACTIAILATQSRVVWAFARDRGLPGWRFVSKVQPKSAIPLPAIIVTSIIACLIGLINIGSSTAFNDVVSLSVSCLYASYIIVEVFLLWRRLTGAIVSPKDIAKHTGEVNQLIWGPFHLPGIFGVLVNVFAIVFGTIIFVFSFFPVATPVAAKTMNFSVLMTGSVVLFATLYYVLSARKTYNGPLVEINPYSTTESTSS